LRHILIASAVAAGTAGVVTVTAMAAAAPMRASATAPPCTPKITTIQGHKAAVNRGQATATLHISGKTYTFGSGFCQQSKSANSDLELNLGTTVVGAENNAGKPKFTIVIGHVHSVASVFSAYYSGAKFTGSWNCHGVVWQAP
jgi:hypothetical protein